jgi:signal transduction histidine kinase
LTELGNASESNWDAQNSAYWESPVGGARKRRRFGNVGAVPQEKTNFLARSIHDFRAPLTAISGYCELLLGDELEPLTAGQRKILGRMQHAARRLTRVTNAMYRLSLAEDAEAMLNLERADIRDCIGQALEEASAVLENKRVSVTVEIEPPAEKLLMEKAQIEQALGNLLESACKFTPRGGAIEIRGYPYFWERRRCLATAPPDSPDRRIRDVRTFNSFRVDIRDSGPAIRAIDAERIFEGYASYAGGQDRSGAGLGLAICRMILNQHGGRVWAESSAAGAVFSLVLPFLPAHPPTSESAAIETEQELTGRD